MKKGKLFPTALAVICILALWQFISVTINYPAIFPDLQDLLRGFFSLFLGIEFYIAIGATILRGIIGFIISLLIAFTLALIANNSHFIKSFFQPFLVLTRSIPVISIVLIALLWFSPNNLPIFIALITMLPILYQNILSGLEHVDKGLLEMAIVFGKSKFTRITDIYLPSAKNMILAGISTAIGFGWRAIIIGEVLAQPLQGIGSQMKNAQAYINIPKLLAWTFTAILISYLFEFILKVVGKHRIISYRFHKKKSKMQQHQTNDSKSFKLIEITKSYHQTKVLDSFSFNFNSDKANYIKAPSGKGKTTLLRIISRTEKTDSGKILVDPNYRYAFSYQDYRLLPWLTVKENIAFAYEHHSITKKQSDDIELVLDKLELKDKHNKFPSELSGGQQQRVCLARALVAKSDVLLLDEPLTGLDDKLKQKIISFISDWTNEYQPIIIWATHEDIMLNEKESNDILIN